MANYYLDRDQRQTYKRRQKFRKIFLFAGLLLLILAVAFGVYLWQNARSSGPVVIKPPTKSYYAGASKRLYKTDRFNFESTSNWQLSAEESLGTTKYVYFTHSLNNNLIELELDILFDKSLDGHAVNYVMPVTIKNNQLVAADLSPRCGDDLVNQQKNAAPKMLNMKFEGASYICDVTGSAEKAAAGIVGGSYDIPLKDPKGNTIIINFALVNNSSSSFTSAFKGVLESFKLN